MPGQARNTAASKRTRKNPSQRGDFTGNKKEALQREHEEQVNARREEIGMISATKASVKDEGVIDLMGGTPKLDLPQSPQDPVVAAATGQDEEPRLTRAEWEAMMVGVDTRLDVDTSGAAPMPVQPTQGPGPDGTRLGGSETSINVYELEPERAQAAQQPGEVLDVEASNEPTLIRSLYEIEDVTIGYGNTFTFHEGYRYKVPRWVAAHLEEKGLCDVLSLNVA